MQNLNRRTFVKSLGLLPGVSQVLSRAVDSQPASAVSPAFPPQPSGPFVLPFRHIHLDFHTNPAITGVGEDFKAEEFAQILKDAAVNSITVFAKCHHGMSYYPTKVGIVHPNLKTDLLGGIIEGCHKAGILVVAYISTMYDQYMWLHHGDWRVLDEQGNEVGLGELAGPLKPELGKICINTPQLDYLAAQAGEVVKNYNVDGLWFDNMTYPQTTGCSCQWCMLDRNKLGMNSASREERIEHSQIVMERAMQRLAPIVKEKKPKARVFFNGPINYGRLRFVRQGLKYSTHIEIESLPGGGWGYGFFEMACRYLRNLGLETMGMTGAFHRSWGDFGAIRNQAALDYECFRMLAQGCECAVGDHLHPTGRLNRITYERIGHAYRSVAEKEPWCTGAKAVTEIGLLTTNISESASKEDGGRSIPDAANVPKQLRHQEDRSRSDLGATNMLEQLHHQFDVLDLESDFNAYKVIILPDFHRFSDSLLRKVRTYLAGGGKLILSHESGLDAEAKGFALPQMGLDYEGPWPHEVQYIEVTDESLDRGLPKTIHILYEKGMAVKTRPGASSLARIWGSYFDRDYKHFQVEQTPYSTPTDYTAVAQKGNIIYIAAPIFQTYADYGYQFHRQLIGNCIAKFLPDQLIKSDAPSIAQITVTEQSGRWIVHILNYVSERRAPMLDIVEDVLPIENLNVSLRLGQRPRQVYLAPQRRNLQLDFVNGYARVVVPIVNGHQMVVFEA